MTAQVANGTRMIPVKRCQRCGQTRPAVDYLKHGRLRRDGYYYLTDTPRCASCEKPEVMTLHRDESGRLRMRIELRDETGAPIRWWDRSTHHYRAMTTVGLRLMTPTGNIVRLQPRSQR